MVSSRRLFSALRKKPTHPNTRRISTDLNAIRGDSAHYRHLSTEVVLDLPGLDCIWSMLIDDLEKFWGCLVSMLID